MLGIYKIKVSGDSLYPRYLHGDMVYVFKKNLLMNFRINDAIVFYSPKRDIFIKIISKIDQNHKKVFVIGTTDVSQDSREFGWISFDDIIGKVIYSTKNSTQK